MAKAKELERWLFVPDTHAPYHDKRAWDLMIRVLGEREFDGVCLLGDFYDCYAVSDYRKDPRRERSIKKEILEARKVLNDLNDYGFQHKMVVLGNHEWRYERYLEQNAPALYEEAMDGDLFGWKAGKWDVVPYMEDDQIGKLNVTHDVGYAGTTMVRRTMLDYMDNVIMGHGHGMTYIVEGNAKGITHVAASFGWLGDVSKVDYKHKMKARKEWVLGFGVGTLRVSNGHMYLTPVPILHDYSCVLDNELFTDRKAA